MAVDHKAHNLVENIEAVVGKRALNGLTKGLKEPTRGTTPKRKAAWAREVVGRMDDSLSPEQCREIMERCGCHIDPRASRRERQVWQECASLEEFAECKREQGWMDDGFLAEGDTLRIKISNGRCHRGLVRGREEPISRTYCLCCAGHLRHGLEAALERPVLLTPESTLISGDPECWFVAQVGAAGDEGTCAGQ